MQNREHRVKIIEEYFKHTGIHNPNILKEIVKRNIPKGTKKRIIDLLDTSPSVK